MKPQKSRILIADDHPLVREGLLQLINRQKDMVCCGEADNSESISTLVRKGPPDLLVLDLRLGDEDGLELIKSLLVEHPKLRILVLSQFHESIYSLRVLKAGARGYVMKHEANTTVIEAIRNVLTGKLVVSAQISEMALQQAVQDARVSSGPNVKSVESLSDREIQVMQLLGRGLSTREIAVTFNLSPKTIETYRENLKSKLGIPNAKALVEFARQWEDSSTRHRKADK